MKYLGIDWGEKRIGLAYGDELGVAVPLPAAVETTKRARLSHIREVVERRNIGALVVGYPLNMNGSAGFKAAEVDAFIEELTKRCALPVHRVDERLSTHHVKSSLRSTGKRWRREDRKSGAIDSRAAALILQDFLEQGKGDAGEVLMNDFDAMTLDRRKEYDE